MESKKVCRFCGEEKDFSEFNKHIAAGPLEEWNLRRCKVCAHKEFVKRYADDEKRSTLNGSSRSWKKANPEKHRRLNQEYRERFPEKVIAQNKLGYAVRKGRIVRQPCEVCGTSERVHAHHASYAPKDWYNVKWLCYKCHAKQHAPK